MGLVRCHFTSSRVGEFCCSLRLTAPACQTHSISKTFHKVGTKKRTQFLFHFSQFHTSNMVMRILGLNLYFSAETIISLSGYQGRIWQCTKSTVKPTEFTVYGHRRGASLLCSSLHESARLPTKLSFSLLWSPMVKQCSLLSHCSRQEAVSSS